MGRGRTVYLIVALLSTRNREQLICISSQALVGLDCGDFVYCLGGAFVFFDNGAYSVSDDRSAHAVVNLCFPSSHYVMLGGLGGVFDCLLCPVGCDTGFRYHGELQICRHMISPKSVRIS